MAADIATPARGSAPAALDDEEESEVLFKGLPMSPAAADKENAGNVPQSPVQGSVAKSPPAGVRVSPASPASLFKRRPKPLEMLAAQNLMQTSSPAAAAGECVTPGSMTRARPSRPTSWARFWEGRRLSRLRARSVRQTY